MKHLVVKKKIIRAAFISSACLLLSAGNFSQAANVTLVDNGNGTVTMANGLVSMTLLKLDGSVPSFYLTGLPTTNLIDSGQD